MRYLPRQEMDESFLASFVGCHIDERLVGLTCARFGGNARVNAGVGADVEDTPGLGGFEPAADEVLLGGVIARGLERLGVGEADEGAAEEAAATPRSCAAPSASAVRATDDTTIADARR